MSKKNVKQLIVNTATNFFSQFGFTKTTMDEIAKHINKAKGVLYYYFKSKEELFNEVLIQELNSTKTELSCVIAKDNNSLATLKEYILVRLSSLNKALNYHETLKADFFDKYNFANKVRDDFANYERSNLTLVLKKGELEGFFEIKNIELTVETILIILNSIEIPLFIQKMYPKLENTVEEISSMICNSLRIKK